MSQVFKECPSYLNEKSKYQKCELLTHIWFELNLSICVIPSIPRIY